jgi:YVTN family beta-propeller protein
MKPLVALRISMLAIAAVGASACPASPPAASPLTQVTDIPLPGGTTRFDYESFDQQRHLLFIAHLGDSEVLAFDTQSQSVIARIKNVSQVHGVLAVPELGLVYATATGTGEVVAIDERSFAITARSPTGRFPDGMAYASESHKLYVSDMRGESETVIDTRNNAVVATIPLGGEVGNSQYDPVSKHVFVNVDSPHQLVEIDPASDDVVGRIELVGAKGNHGLLIAPDQRLAFVACEDNAKLLAVDLRARKVQATFTLGDDPDVLAYDAAAGLLYVASESGIVSVFKSDAGGVTKLSEGFVGADAHVVAVDTVTHHVYFPLKNVAGRAVLRVMHAR